MNRIWTFLLNPRVLGVIGLAALAAFLFLGAEVLQLALVWAAVALAVFFAVWLGVWAVRQLRARRAARALEQAIDPGPATVPGKGDKADVSILRSRLLEAVQLIKKSKLGQAAGNAALYELPWYMVIGNPAAGKSTAIVKSGLKFPFADGGDAVIQGIGGTRNCDWFFTSEGILLDTAGRYAVHDEDRAEWLGFLGLLKRHRPKAPINGILIAASLAELGSGRPEAAIHLAKNLRQRVQELTETLEVIAPVYLVFTKADLIAGFAEFFEDRDRAERERVWGATLSYDAAQRGDAVAAFDKHFDELYEGLREMSLARMGMERGKVLPPGVLTFPLEFAERKAALRAFVATLFEENPYQYQPVFRGFYFTSSVQEGVSASRASERVAQQFALEPRAERVSGLVVAENGFFLKELFSRVIFADKGLVQQHASRGKQRLRLASFAAAVIVLAAALGGWTWSYVGNRQLMANVRADLQHVIKLQAENPDLASRLQAMETLQDRIEQLQRYRDSRPFGIGLGLYQGDEIEAKLRHEYFNGVRQVMLEPAALAIEAYLTEVSANPARLKALGKAPESGAVSAASPRAAARYVDASVEDAGDAYNALKTYLMLADHDHLEPVHLAEQITRFWRGWLDNNRGSMPRESLMQSAERMITFTTANTRDADFPVVPNKLVLVEQMREILREQRRGLKGVERVYADVKARAATRFAPITVAQLVPETDKDAIAGSYAIPGTFTRQAWDGYVAKAFKDAATQELQSADWVLKVAVRDDLTQEGSPEQIQKQLTELYKTEYVREWQRFMQGISVPEFGTFDGAVSRMNRLGDPKASPIRTVLTTLFDQTSWDNPSLLNERLGQAQKGVLAWIKQTILRQAPQGVEMKVDVDGASVGVPMGPIGREFASLARVMMSRDSSPPLINGYLESLSKVRTRFNQIKNQGNPGPGSRTLLAATLEGPGSELADALKLVDEQMLVGMTDTAKASLRPLLVRPLIQALAVVVPPAETEVNRVWAAQVYEPFQRTLATKYPFDMRSTVEAAPQDISKIFGPDGAVAKFAGDALGPLVVRRGDTIEPRQWAEIGIQLRPEFSASFAGWVGQLDAASSGGGSAGTGGTASVGAANGGVTGAVVTSPDQTVFQVLPQGAPGLSEYSLTIDGQTLRYRNAAPEWVTMVWPNRAGVSGARLAGLTNDGKPVEFVNEPGNAGLGKLMELAQKRRLDGGVNELTWGQGPLKVTLQLKLLRQPGEAAPPPSTTAARAAGSTAGGGSVAIGASRLQGLKLPALVAGGEGGAAAPDKGPSSTAALAGKASR